MYTSSCILPIDIAVAYSLPVAYKLSIATLCCLAPAPVVDILASSMSSGSLHLPGVFYATDAKYTHTYINL